MEDTSNEKTQMHWHRSGQQVGAADIVLKVVQGAEENVVGEDVE
jgi:hypothetical protein